MMVVRPARTGDLPGLMELARLSGHGFTSLPEDEGVLARRLERAEASFAAKPNTPGDEVYFMMLEDAEAGAIAGCCAVKATVGLAKPFYSFKILRQAQASQAAGRRFDMDVMVLVNEFPGCSEVGSLFVREEARGGGVGRLVAQARYLLIAADRARFSDRIIAELRGVVDADGRSPLWEHLGAKFFDMTFREADHLSSVTDNQFILDLMPRYPIYLDLLPPAAREVVGKVHPDGVPAQRLLEWEGFAWDRVVDIFDGGPTMAASRDTLRTVRESRRRTVQVGDVDATTRHVSALVSTDRFPDFRACRARVGVNEDDAIVIPDAAARALDVETGASIRIWEHHA